MSEPFPFYPLRFRHPLERDFIEHNMQALDWGLSASPENWDLVQVDDGELIQVFGPAGPSGFASLFRRADGITWSYSHQRKPIEIRIGDVLEAGTIFGKAGSTGNVDPAGSVVLHFKVRDAMGRVIDPEPLLGHPIGAIDAPRVSQKPETTAPREPESAGGGDLLALVLLFLITREIF